MSTLALILLGMIIGWAVIQWLRARRSLAPRGTDSTEHEQLSDQQPSVETTTSLSLKLHAINDKLEPFARNAAHANEIAEHVEFRKAVAMFDDPGVTLEMLKDYAFGQAWLLSCAAFAALAKRSNAGEVACQIPNHFDGFAVWQMRFALQHLAATRPRLAAGLPLLGYRDWWSDTPQVRHVFQAYFASLSDDDESEPGADVAALPVATRQQIATFLARVCHPIANRLAAKLGVPAAHADPAASGSFLATLGRFWDLSNDPLLIEPECWKAELKAVERAVERRPARVLMVSGETMVGKTAFLHLLARRFVTKGWRVFQASGSDLQAGQIYIGQLEGRIRQALDELNHRHKIIWYVPDLLALAMSGTHQSQSASILDQIWPALSSGQVLVWTEATPAAMARLQQLRPAVRRSLEIVRIDAMAADETLALAQSLSGRLAKTSGATIDPAFAVTAVDVAQHYLSSASLPGAALILMRTTAQQFDKSKAQRLSGADVLTTLSQLTGLPMSILDGAERLSLESTREFFSNRVIGQPEAVASVVERIAMLKSGLNDPGKPIAVFLFAGPTGTGKTELAKATAEYLFGSVDRMIRLDMSEFQTHEAIGKILGGGGLGIEAETLISRVRKQPFSLVLLDEFEKAHPQIWDLFLQVFDDGRLSDASGQVADFRHSLIILTTNLGAIAHRDSGLGFKPSGSSFTNDQVMRAIGQTFRPEFQNRLDKVIVFKPLTRELMKKILSKELGRIFERRGLKDRDWAVEWDASALEFLLEKGFSPDMGARPLKRAIDHYVIAPLAETIVERRFPEGDQFVFVRRDGGELRADFVDPDGDGEPFRDDNLAEDAATTELPTLTALMRAPSGTRSEVFALDEALSPITARMELSDWREHKDKLTAEINSADFWSRVDRFETLARLELMDRLSVAAQTAVSLQGRLTRSGGGTSKTNRDLVRRLASQIYLVNEGLKDLDGNAPVEVAQIVVPAFAAGTDEDEEVTSWCKDVAAMYSAWARSRGMRSSTLGEIAGFGGPALIVAGFGAYRTLARESGLHILERGAAARSTRITAQVLTATVPAGAASKADIRKSLAVSFKAGKSGTNIVRRYRRHPSPMVRNGDGTWRSGKVEDVLRGNFDLWMPDGACKRG